MSIYIRPRCACFLFFISLAAPSLQCFIERHGPTTIISPSKISDEERAELLKQARIEHIRKRAEGMAGALLGSLESGIFVALALNASPVYTAAFTAIPAVTSYLCWKKSHKLAAVANAFGFLFFPCCVLVDACVNQAKK